MGQTPSEAGQAGSPARRSAAGFLLAGGGLAGALAWLAASTVQRSPVGLQGGDLVLLGISAAAVAAISGPMGGRGDVRTTLGLLTWGLLVAAGAMTWAAPWTQGSAPLRPLAGVAAAAAATAFLVGRLLRSARSVAGRVRTAEACVWSGVALFTFAPVWAAPAALALGGPAWGECLLWLSPISLFSGLAEFDFLRSPWFYAHCPLAALPIRYPGPEWPGLTYLALGVALGWQRRQSQIPIEPSTDKEVSG